MFLPPGSAKSTYASVLFPPWYLAQRPDACIIGASHTQELAEKWGRRVRNLLSANSAVLNIGIAGDNSAAGRWETTAGGEYLAAGIGGGISGRRADLAIIDDPLRSREDADSQKVRDKQWDWWRFDLSPRLKPNAGVILIQCMTGDTMVMLGTGHEKPMRDIRPGDEVATYRGGVLSTSVVRNWIRNGVDRVYEIKTTSGITVKANERHPFLVCEDGEPKWIRTRDLHPGHEIFRVNGASGRAPSALTTGAKIQLCVEDTAPRITTKNDGQTVFGLLRSTLSRAATLISSTVMGLMPSSTISCSPSRTESALCVATPLAGMFALTGAENSASITATILGRLGAFFATTAILWSDMQRHRKPLSLPLNTSDFILEKVIEVSGAGAEEVFDIQIDQTENFIANGLVSHNTRWHEDDLAGRLLRDEGDRWKIIKLPMEADSADDPLGRALGEPLWPEWFNDQMRADAKRDPRVWSALYQQEPVPETGNYFHREWLIPVDAQPPRDSLRVYGGSDYAVTASGGDYTVHAVLGVDADGNPYLLDIWRRQAASDEWVSAFCDLVRKWKPMAWAEETGQIKSGVGPFLEREMRDRRAYTAREQFPTKGDKAVRAQSFRGMIATRGLRIPANAPWRADFEAELLRFPAGVHDDQVDAVGLIGQLLDKMLDGPAKPSDEAVARDDYRESRHEYNEGLDPMTL